MSDDERDIRALLETEAGRAPRPSGLRRATIRRGMGRRVGIVTLPLLVVAASAWIAVAQPFAADPSPDMAGPRPAASEPPTFGRYRFSAADGVDRPDDAAEHGVVEINSADGSVCLNYYMPGATSAYLRRQGDDPWRFITIFDLPTRYRPSICARGLEQAPLQAVIDDPTAHIIEINNKFTGETLTARLEIMGQPDEGRTEISDRSIRVQHLVDELKQKLRVLRNERRRVQRAAMRAGGSRPSVFQVRLDQIEDLISRTNDRLSRLRAAIRGVDCLGGIEGNGTRMTDSYPPKPYFEAFNLWRTPTDTGRTRCLTIAAGRQQDRASEGEGDQTTYQANGRLFIFGDYLHTKDGISSVEVPLPAPVRIIAYTGSGYDSVLRLQSIADCSTIAYDVRRARFDPDTFRGPLNCPVKQADQ